MQSSWGRWMIVAFVVIGEIGCREDASVIQEEIVRPVRYQRVVAAGPSRERSFSGAARAGAQITLSFKVGGTVRVISVNRGDSVRQGALVAELDPRDYELHVEEVEASLAQARAQARYAAADYDRVRGLYENSNTSKDDLDAARTAAESAAAAVRSVEKRLELAQLQLSYTRLTSPTDGQVEEVPVEVNENVGTGDPIVILTTGERPEVEVAVPESLIRQIRSGSAVRVRFDALPGETFSATATEVGVAPTRSATTFPVTVRLAHPEPRILPGMAAEVGFQFATSGGEDRFVLPTHAVGEDPDGHFVYVVEPQEDDRGIVHRRNVVVGELMAGGLEIVEGLQSGDLAVTAGISRIQNEQEVRLLDSNQD